jgi:hypothetical protein
VRGHLFEDELTAGPKHPGGLGDRVPPGRHMMDDAEVHNGVDGSVSGWQGGGVTDGDFDAVLHVAKPTAGTGDLGRVDVEPAHTGRTTLLE